MTAKLGDVGISRILDPTGATLVTQAAGSFGYIGEYEMR